MAARKKASVKKASVKREKPSTAYTHPASDMALRPEVGTQAQFRKKKPAAMYRYDSSLAPSMEWDGTNGAREHGEWLLKLAEDAAKLPAPHCFDKPRALKGADGKVIASCAGLQEAIDQLHHVSQPFLNWAGKAERYSFDLPTLPLFVHERLSTKAIIETLKTHEKQKAQTDFFDLFADPKRSVLDQVLKAYEYRDKWVNRMILGDSLVVMNSLLHYENLSGQVQMIYIDPPYGVKFGSNFQPFVRKRGVEHNDDQDMTREPEMVQAYRDTWELGLHSYLAYLRDRLLLSRDLLHQSGSVFVQISDENMHHVRELMDEVFGAENFVAAINFKTMMPLESGNIEAVVDYLCWYAKDKNSIKYRNLYAPKNVGDGSEFVFCDAGNGTYRRLSKEEVTNFSVSAQKLNIFKRSDLTSSGYTASCTFPITFEGKPFETKKGKSWRTTTKGVEILKNNHRLFVLGSKIYYKMYLKDFGFTSLINQWTDTIEFGSRSYVVQTTATVLQRCILMTTDPGDLVLDPTCGGGTTAYVAEQWGRRWITIDTSRVPLALARQRLLTATYPYYELKEESRGPAGGFVYKRKQNRRGEEIGGIVPHITLKNIANNEPPEEEVLVDRPEENNHFIRVSGPFVVEATMPMPVDWETDGGVETGNEQESYGSFIDRMLEVLRKSPVLQVGGGKTVTLKNVRLPTKSLSLSAEALATNGQDRPVAFVFGPENGAVSEKLVYEAAREAHAKNYSHLYVIGFSIHPNARGLIESCEQAVGIAATWVTATPDLMMGDLLKNMRSSQIFAVCGMPDAKLCKIKPGKDGIERYQVKLLGLDVFDPITMDTLHRKGDDVPCWMLDTDYNGLVFHGTQVFFPRTSAWESLKKALKATYEETVWDHLAGSASAPFEEGEHGQIAVKVIDDRGNELLVVKSLKDIA